jgi:hypothetical protein
MSPILFFQLLYSIYGYYSNVGVSSINHTSLNISSQQDRIIPADPITGNEKIKTLKRLDQVIQQRLVTSKLPPQMSSLVIGKRKSCHLFNYFLFTNDDVSFCKASFVTSRCFRADTPSEWFTALHSKKNFIRGIFLPKRNEKNNTGNVIGCKNCWLLIRAWKELSPCSVCFM